ncbi:glycosyltransferase [Polaribacter staleyi]|uniref:glycosyltransferase n=1 Tax=Polaribacter staleyi TaxID=2022337 RepID=UPI0031BA3849
MKKIKVLQLIDSLNVGGAEVLTINIANALSKEKTIESYLCATREEGLLKEKIDLESVKYFFLKRKKTLDIKAFYKLISFCKREKIEIIHAHTNSFFMAFIIRLFYTKIKVVWHNHTGDNINLKGLKLYILKITSFYFETIINVNKPLNDWSVRCLNSMNSVFLNNFPFFKKEKNKTFLKGEYGKRIVCLAAFRPEKDHLNLLKAFQILVKENKDWTLHLVGNVNKDLYSNKILDLIEVKGLKKHIFVYGSQLDIEHILGQATIGVLSSNSEGLPIALLEYGLAKLPVVVTDVGECSKVVENGQSGIVVEKENSKEFLKALEMYISDEDKRKCFGEMHYKNVQKKYSQQEFISQLIKLYTS